MSNPPIARKNRKIEVSIVVPTYNERDNVQPLVDGLRNALDGTWNYEVIVVDDSSPDGTAELVRQLAEWDPRIRLIQRPQKLGLGSAVVDGFRMATGDYWVMMDADLSHRPDDLPGLLNTLSEADIVVGSRYIPGGDVMNWPLHRRLVSRGASAVARFLAGLSVRDATSGFAAFRRETVEPILPTLDPRGFKLLLEILAKCPRSVVKEEPILFVNRQRGRSKLSSGEALSFVRLCLRLLRVRGRISGSQGYANRFQG